VRDADFALECVPNKPFPYYNKTGDLFLGKLEYGSRFLYAKLMPGEGNSGKLVSEIKKTATNNISETTEWIIIDGPPGIGCPVNASLSGTDFVVIVAEPTLSGLHDLKRLLELLKTMKYRHGIVINKYDLNQRISDLIKKLAKNNNIDVLGYLPFHHDFVRSLQLGKTIIEYNDDIKKQIEDIWAEICNQLNKTKGSEK